MDTLSKKSHTKYANSFLTLLLRMLNFFLVDVLSNTVNYPQHPFFFYNKTVYSVPLYSELKKCILYHL